jgi:hypothetical protein
MCQNPILLPSGDVIACRKCDRCRRNRINDWVGRCIAESRYATATHSVTLTYGPDENGNEDHVHSALLIYRDMQNYFKKLRFDGYKFKYLVAGEYGSKKRRAHWHLIIFWDGPHPEIEFNKNYDHKYWSWGFTHWQQMTPESVWYVCKYIQKETEKDDEAMLRMSKKPPLGHEWFQQWAQQHVLMGVSPKTLHYSFDGVTHKDGQRREYYMQGVTADNFLKAYCLEFVRQKGHLKIPYSELVDEWIDNKYAKYYDLDKWIKEQNYGKQVVEAIKKNQLFVLAKAHGGVSEYHPGIHPDLQPLVVCTDNHVIEYGEPTDDRIQEFIRVISAK